MTRKTRVKKAPGPPLTFCTPSTIDIPRSLRWPGCQTTVLPAPWRYRGACGGLAARLQYSQHRRDTGEPAVAWLPDYSTPSTVEIPGSLRWSGCQATVLPAPLQYSQHHRHTKEPMVAWLPDYSTPSTIDIPRSLWWPGCQTTVLPAPWRYRGACGGLAARLQYSQHHRHTKEPAVAWLPDYSTPSTVEIPGSLRWPGCQATVLPAPWRYRGACGGLAARLQYSQHHRHTKEPTMVWLPGYSTPSTVETPGSLRWSGCQATRYRGAYGGLAARLQYSQHRRDTGEPAVVWLPGYSTPSTIETPGSLQWSGYQATVLPALLQYSQHHRDTREPAVVWLPGYSTPSTIETPGSLQWSGYQATRYRGAYGGLAARLQYSLHRRDTGEPTVVWLPGYSTPSTIEIPGSLRWSGCQATASLVPSLPRTAKGCFTCHRLAWFPASTGELRAWFPASTGRLRGVLQATGQPGSQPPQASLGLFYWPQASLVTSLHRPA
ncbi:hypothetical protein Bbelb_098570 [Branchiostoma belcheri]|nr:hypothetical protein Bbelb_098570 [Branchiostoma belcheri]